MQEGVLYFNGLRRSRKFISAFVAATFLLTNTVFASPNGKGVSISGDRESGIGDSRSLSPITQHLSPDLGSIDETYKGKSDKTVYYIQDAHDSLEAQENIAKIIAAFVKERGIPTVYEEGFEGVFPSDELFGGIHDKNIKEKTSYFFLDQLRLGAAEYAHINRAQDFKLIGADSIKLHLENVDWAQKTARTRQETAKNLQEIAKHFQTLSDKYFPKALKEQLKLRERFDNKQLGLADYIFRLFQLVPSNSYLVTSSSKNQLQSQYPHLAIVTQYLNKTQLTQQESKDLETKLKAIDAKTLFREIEQFEQEFVNRSLVTATVGLPAGQAGDSHQTERNLKIYQYSKTLSLLQRLNNLEATPEEYEVISSSYLVASSSKNQLPATNYKLQTQDFADFVAKHTGKSVIFSSQWEEGIQNARNFYETAKTRDLSIAASLEGFLKDPTEKESILVYGGFHKQAIRGILKELGLSYVIVSPRITKPDPLHQLYYKELMSKGFHSYEMPRTTALASRVVGLGEYFVAFSDSVSLAVLESIAAVSEAVTKAGNNSGSSLNKWLVKNVSLPLGAAFRPVTASGASLGADRKAQAEKNEKQTAWVELDDYAKAGSMLLNNGSFAGSYFFAEGMMDKVARVIDFGSEGKIVVSMSQSDAPHIGRTELSIARLEPDGTFVEYLGNDQGPQFGNQPVYLKYGLFGQPEKDMFKKYATEAVDDIVKRLEQGVPPTNVLRSWIEMAKQNPARRTFGGAKASSLGQGASNEDVSGLKRAEAYVTILKAGLGALESFHKNARTDTERTEYAQQIESKNREIILAQAEVERIKQSSAAASNASMIRPAHHSSSPERPVVSPVEPSRGASLGTTLTPISGKRIGDRTILQIGPRVITADTKQVLLLGLVEAQETGLIPYSIMITDDKNPGSSSVWISHEIAGEMQGKLVDWRKPEEILVALNTKRNFKSVSASSLGQKKSGVFTVTQAVVEQVAGILKDKETPKRLAAEDITFLQWIAKSKGAKISREEQEKLDSILFRYANPSEEAMTAADAKRIIAALRLITVKALPEGSFARRFVPSVLKQVDSGKSLSYMQLTKAEEVIEEYEQRYDIQLTSASSLGHQTNSLRGAQAKSLVSVKALIVQMREPNPDKRIEAIHGLGDIALYDNGEGELRQEDLRLALNALRDSKKGAEPRTREAIEDTLQSLKHIPSKLTAAPLTRQAGSSLGESKFVLPEGFEPVSSVASARQAGDVLAVAWKAKKLMSITKFEKDLNGERSFYQGERKILYVPSFWGKSARNKPEVDENIIKGISTENGTVKLIVKDNDRYLEVETNGEVRDVTSQVVVEGQPLGASLGTGNEFASQSFHFNPSLTNLVAPLQEIQRAVKKAGLKKADIGFEMPGDGWSNPSMHDLLRPGTPELIAGQLLEKSETIHADKIRNVPVTIDLVGPKAGRVMEDILSSLRNSGSISASSLGAGQYYAAVDTEEILKELLILKGPQFTSSGLESEVSMRRTWIQRALRWKADNLNGDKLIQLESSLLVNLAKVRGPSARSYEARQGIVEALAIVAERCDPGQLPRMILPLQNALLDIVESRMPSQDLEKRDQIQLEIIFQTNSILKVFLAIAKRVDTRELHILVSALPAVTKAFPDLTAKKTSDFFDESMNTREQLGIVLTSTAERISPNEFPSLIYFIKDRLREVPAEGGDPEEARWHTADALAVILLREKGRDISPRNDVRLRLAQDLLALSSEEGEMPSLFPDYGNLNKVRNILTSGDDRTVIQAIQQYAQEIKAEVLGAKMSGLTGASSSVKASEGKSLGRVIPIPTSYAISGYYEERESRVVIKFGKDGTINAQTITAYSDEELVTKLQKVQELRGPIPDTINIRIARDEKVKNGFEFKPGYIDIFTLDDHRAMKWNDVPAILERLHEMSPKTLRIESQASGASLGAVQEALERLKSADDRTKLMAIYELGEKDLYRDGQGRYRISDLSLAVNALMEASEKANPDIRDMIMGALENLQTDVTINRRPNGQYVARLVTPQTSGASLGETRKFVIQKANRIREDRKAIEALGDKLHLAVLDPRTIDRKNHVIVRAFDRRFDLKERFEAIDLAQQIVNQKEDSVLEVEAAGPDADRAMWNMEAVIRDANAEYREILPPGSGVTVFEGVHGANRGFGHRSLSLGQKISVEEAAQLREALDHVPPANVFLPADDMFTTDQMNEMNRLAKRNPRNVRIIFYGAGKEKPAALDAENIIFTPLSAQEASRNKTISLERGSNNFLAFKKSMPQGFEAVVQDNKFRYSDDKDGLLGVLLLRAQAEDKTVFDTRWGLLKVDGFLSLADEKLLKLVHDHVAKLKIGKAA